MPINGSRRGSDLCASHPQWDRPRLESLMTYLLGWELEQGHLHVHRAHQPACRGPVVELLTHGEGLRIGAEAPDIAVYAGAQEMHISFEGREAFVAFGTKGCEPCGQLVAAAAAHPATRNLRRIYISDADGVEGDADVVGSWELYRFHDEAAARKVWRAPVSPYFHLIDSDRRIVAKGVANRVEHLDRLLA